MLDFAAPPLGAAVAPAPIEPSDESLVAGCRAGDESAWQRLVRRYERLVYTVPRRAGLSEELAADVFQATFTRLFRHLDGLSDASRVRAWLVTTARRETLRALDERRRHAGVELTAGPDEVDPLAQIADESPLPDALLQSLQAQDRIRRAVARLDEKSRRFIELCCLQDEPLPYAEVAARLGMPVGSVGPTRARCLARLRELLSRDGGD